jgi:hypothetical protein
MSGILRIRVQILAARHRRDTEDGLMLVLADANRPAARRAGEFVKNA